MYLQHGILPFPTLIRQELLTLGYKIGNNQIPMPFIELYRKYKGKNNHKYHTRRKNIPKVQ